MEVRGIPLKRAMRDQIAPLQQRALYVPAREVLHRPVTGLAEHESPRRLGNWASGDAHRDAGPVRFNADRMAALRRSHGGCPSCGDAAR